MHGDYDDYFSVSDMNDVLKKILQNQYIEQLEQHSTKS